MYIHNVGTYRSSNFFLISIRAFLRFFSSLSESLFTTLLSKVMSTEYLEQRTGPKPQVKLTQLCPHAPLPALPDFQNTNFYPGTLDLG